MDSNCKYFGSILVTVLLYSTAVSYPAIRSESECETLSNLYPPKFNFNDTLNSCHHKNLSEPVLTYCTELALVWNEISSCGLGSLLKEVSSNTPLYLEILRKSQKVPMAEDICKVFKDLNSSLYKVYLDKPGFGKLIAGPFCSMFCNNKYEHYCEMLLRTYWIKKVLQDFKEVTKESNNKPDFKEVAKQTNNKPDTSMKTSIIVPHEEKHTKQSEVNPAYTGTSTGNIPVHDEQQTKSKAELNNHVTTDMQHIKNTPVLQNSPKPEVEQPGGMETQKNDKAKKSKSDGKLSIADGDTSLDIHTVTSDSNLHITANSKLNPNSQKDPSNFENEQKTKQKNPADNTIKSKNEQAIGEDSSLKAKPIDPVNDASGTKTKSNDPSIDAKELKTKPTVPLPVASETKEIPPPPIIQPSENDKNEGSDNLDEQISVVPDKTVADDLATNLERDTEHGNQMRDFGDGYAVNEYQDAGPPDESEIPLPDENAQVSTKDDNKNLQPDETNIGKQTNNVPQISSFPEEEDSHFFAYFLTIIVFCIAGYLVFHNKQKIIALIIEGRHERRRRPNNGTYKRLDSKDGAKATSHVIF